MPRSRLTPEERERVAHDALARLQAGETLANIAAGHGVTGETMRAWLLEVGYVPRARTDFSADERTAIVERMRQLLDSGAAKSISAAARALGINGHTAAAWARAAGLERRHSPEPTSTDEWNEPVGYRFVARLHSVRSLSELDEVEAEVARERASSSRRDAALALIDLRRPIIEAAISARAESERRRSEWARVEAERSALYRRQHDRLVRRAARAS